MPGVIVCDKGQSTLRLVDARYDVHDT